MRIKKIGIALIVTFLARLVISCCDCQETKNYQYTFDSFATFNLDNSGMSPIVSDSNISKEAFGLRIELSLSQIASCKRNYFFGFFESYALDCMCPPEIKYIAKDTITSIIITTISDFDSQHFANSNVTEYFKVLDWKKYISINEYINNPENIYYEKPERETIDLFLLTPPSNPGEYSFKIDIALSNDTVISVTSKTINLK